MTGAHAGRGAGSRGAYRRVLVPIELCGAAAARGDHAAIARAALDVASPGATFVLLPVVESQYALIARELPPAGPPDRPLADSLRARDRAAERLADAVAQALARAGAAAIAIAPAEAPLTGAALRAAAAHGVDAIVVTLPPRPPRGGRRCPAPDDLVARAPSSLAVFVVRPAETAAPRGAPVVEPAPAQRPTRGPFARLAGRLAPLRALASAAARRP